MTQKLYQIHLYLPGMSGRGVRFRALPPSVHREAKSAAAQKMPSGVTGAGHLVYRDLVVTECLRRMILQVTQPIGEQRLTGEEVQAVQAEVADVEDEAARNRLAAAKLVALSDGKRKAALDAAKWIDVNHQQLTLPGDYTWDELFTAKDTEQLEDYYQEFHEITASEATVLMGKAIPVTTTS